MSRQWGIMRLPLAALASAVSVPIVIVTLVVLLVVASFFDGFDSRAALGVVIIAEETVRSLGNSAVWFAGMSFALFPAAALLTRERAWLRSTVLPVIGATVGAVIASEHPYAEATYLSAAAGLISGVAFAFVMRDEAE